MNTDIYPESRICHTTMVRLLQRNDGSSMKYRLQPRRHARQEGKRVHVNRSLHVTMCCPKQLIMQKRPRIYDSPHANLHRPSDQGLACPS